MKRVVSQVRGLRTIAQLVVSAVVLTLFAAAAWGETPAGEPRLQKACAELDELYGAYLESNSDKAEKAEARAGAAAHENFDLTDHFRQTIQFSKLRDTTWVKLVITVDKVDNGATRTDLIDKGLRRVSQFGSMISGQLPIQNLPSIDRMKSVERIEPVTPSAYTARSSMSVAANSPSKKN